ncbi:MAG: MlaD family protein [Synechococcaceae cyanobacterium]|nr:MlaD family protein [Synechococcaceae cyanobacterium]
MRRSVREALVGFSVLAAISGALGLWFWLKGINLRRDVWTIQASFADAAGLAARSPVSFRGVLVGTVRRVRVTDQAVFADLEITDPDLRLARPVVARVGTGSLLGGDAVVSLISAGRPLPEGSPRPRDPRCDDGRMVCHRGVVRGVEAASLDSVTESVQRLLDQADRSRLVPQMVAATTSFQRTAREAEKLSRQGQVFLGDARGLVRNASGAVDRVDPILTNIEAASADAARATREAARAGRDVSTITGALNNPRTVEDIQATLANARRLTRNWAAVGGNVNRLTGDEAFLDAIRSVAVGLGSFFEDLYPAQVDAARQRDARDRPPEGGGAEAPGAPKETSSRSHGLPPLPPPPRKQRVLSAADQREADRVEAAGGFRPR